MVYHVAAIHALKRLVLFAHRRLPMGKNPLCPLCLCGEKYKHDSLPVDEGCSCQTCSHYSRADLRHMFLSGEPLGVRLAVIHNLHFLETMMALIRKAIKNGRLREMRREWMG